MSRLLFVFLLLAGLCCSLHVKAQQPPFFSLQPADSLHKARLWAGVGVGAAAYGTALVVLHRNWADDGSSGHFRTVNDLPDWNQMDKMGHWFLSYTASRWFAAGTRWAGVKQRPAAWLGFAGGQLLMTTLEVFDGFSASGGFSWSDMGFNFLGGGMFAAQELGWGEQRFTMKVSAWPKQHPSGRLYPASPLGSDGFTTLEERSEALYGKGLLSLFLKNYNANTMWLSVNPRAFMSDRATWCPRWLNIAVGMGAENLYNARGYRWKGNLECEGPDCDVYALDPEQYPRTRQFYLSFDVDLTRLPIRNRFLRTLAGAVNIIKFPAPALEITDRGAVRVRAVTF